jgi:carbonic anhydrase/acetyltransferase-like protein (isoleucine patch superfamily)
MEGRLRLKVHRGGVVMIGDHVQMNCGFWCNPVGNECQMCIWVGPRGVLKIESGAGLSGTTIVCQESVTVGERTYVGGGTRIYDTDFHSLDPAVRLRCHDNQIRTAPVRIGQECFIGGHSIILKGVRIGDRSVIGAGSVVARDVPADEIWAGNPVKFIRPLVRTEIANACQPGREA